jgi:hypothetical protein
MIDFSQMTIIMGKISLSLSLAFAFNGHMIFPLAHHLQISKINSQLQTSPWQESPHWNFNIPSRSFMNFIGRESER